MEQIYYVIGTIIVLTIIFKAILALKPKGYYKKVKPKLPGSNYKLFYTDEKGTKRKSDVIYSKLLYSKKYDINGKPDFIYINKNTDMLLPVELKSGSIGELLEPRPGDLMQLGAYFIIIEDVFDSRPLKGRIIYNDAMFLVKNTKKLRKDTMDVVKDMREMLLTGEQEANSSYTTCKNCVCKHTVCEYCE